jgi:hypothetical protein
MTRSTDRKAVSTKNMDGSRDHVAADHMTHPTSSPDWAARSGDIMSVSADGSSSYRLAANLSAKEGFLYQNQSDSEGTKKRTPR